MHLCVSQMHRRGYVRREVEGGVHERKMREGLRKVPEQPSGLRVELLGQQAQVVPELDETREELVCLVVASQQLVAVAEPERARQKHALAGRQTVGLRVRA